MDLTLDLQRQPAPMQLRSWNNCVLTLPGLTVQYVIIECWWSILNQTLTSCWFYVLVLYYCDCRLSRWRLPCSCLLQQLCFRFPHCGENKGNLQVGWSESSPKVTPKHVKLPSGQTETKTFSSCVFSFSLFCSSTLSHWCLFNCSFI